MVCQAAENEGLFDADLPYRCHARTAVLQARERMPDDTPASAALMFVPQLRKGDRP